MYNIHLLSMNKSWMIHCFQRGGEASYSDMSGITYRKDSAFWLLDGELNCLYKKRQNCVLSVMEPTISIDDKL